MSRAGALWLLLACAVCCAGCDGIFEGEHWLPAQIMAVSAPESLIAGDPVAVRVYSYAGCAEQTFPTQFVAVNDSTFELYVAHGGGTRGALCPAFLQGEEFALPHAPAGRFHLRCRGADTLDVTVYGGEAPAATVRHTFRPVRWRPLTGGTALTLVGCHSEGEGRLVCGDTLATYAIDGEEPLTFTGPCALGGTQYEARVEGGLYLGMQGTLYCRQPWQTLIRF